MQYKCIAAMQPLEILANIERVPYLAELISENKIKVGKKQYAIFFDRFLNYLTIHSISRHIYM